MGRVLKARVHVTDERGRAHVFAPGDEVPDWATERITNPKVWDSEPAEAQASDLVVSVEPPPVHGPGASRAKWAAYAAAHRPDVTVIDEMTQRDIVAACSEGAED